MHLREGEVVEKTIRRHPTPYFFKLTKIMLLSAPLYVLLFYLAHAVSGEWILYVFALVSFFVGIIIALVSIDYLLDKLIVTNKRIIWINWKSLFNKEEHETELLDIVDIETKGKGVLSKLRIFNYGLLSIETAATKTFVDFQDCPNPEGLNHFIIERIARRKSKVFGKKEMPERHQEIKADQADEEWSVN